MKIKRLLTYLLLFIMLFNTSIVFAQDDAINDGLNFGHTDGYIYVLTNYNYGGDIPASPPSLPNDSTIFSRYYSYLSGKTEAFKRNFYVSYIQGYLEGYSEGRALLLESGVGQPSSDVKVNFAKSLGQSMGEIYGFRDYYNNLKASWTRAIPSNTKLFPYLIWTEKQHNIGPHSLMNLGKNLKKLMKRLLNLHY